MPHFGSACWAHPHCRFGAVFHAVQHHALQQYLRMKVGLLDLLSCCSHALAWVCVLVEQGQQYSTCRGRAQRQWVRLHGMAGRWVPYYGRHARTKLPETWPVSCNWPSGSHVHLCGPGMKACIMSNCPESPHVLLATQAARLQHCTRQLCPDWQACALLAQHNCPHACT